MFSRTLRTSALLLAGMLAIFAGNRASAHSDDETPAANYLSGGDFTLNSPDGLLSLSDLRGKVVLVFFGYTSCPDVCPLSLARINAGFRTMGDEELERVRALFITLDPERDTNERLRKYVGYFHPNIIGLRDDVEGIKNVAKNFGVEFSRKVVPNSALGYSISHPTDILLLDRQGRFVKAVPHNIEVGRLVALIRGLLNAND